MNYCINTSQLWEKNLTPSQYIFMLCIKDNNNNVLIHSDDLKALVEREYVSKTGTGWILRVKGLDLINSFNSKNIKENELEEFVEEYRDIFPKGIKSGNGTPIRGDKQGCYKKMEWFLKTYPEYSKQIILKSTEKYIKDLQSKGYAYVTQADYLIQKDGGSKLAALCEEYNIKNSINMGEKRL